MTGVQNFTTGSITAPAPNVTLTDQLVGAHKELCELTDRLMAVSDRVCGTLPRAVDNAPRDGAQRVPSLQSMAAEVRVRIDALRDIVARLDVSV